MRAPGGIWRIALVATILMATGWAVAPSFGVAPASAAAGDVGYLGPTYGTAVTDPTESKPESKLWYNDGTWWAVLYDAASTDFHISRLRLASHTWVDTGTLVDERPGSRADVLWDGTHLYVASHIYSTSPATGNPARLLRYSYDSGSKTYTADGGFPVSINDYRTETLVLDKDSTGVLWATWTQGKKVWVSHTTTSDTSWVTPYVPPTAGTSLASDDISSVIAFGPGKIGVMWSNQSTDAMYFAVHQDGADDASWQVVKQAVAGPGLADDHINLKSLQSDGTGRVFAAVKTSLTASNSPAIFLLVRDPATGDWSNVVFGRVSDNFTRPVVMLDTSAGVIHMFATAPQTNGTIYVKTTSIDNPSFAPGLGTVFMKDAASAHLNNVTSTKQNVNSTTGLVMLAGNETADHYWWNYDSLGGGPGPTPTPTATPTPTPTPTATSAPGQTLTFAAAADANIRSDKATTNYGTITTMRVREATDGTSIYRPYVRFAVAGVGSSQVASVKLRLFVSTGTGDGGTVYPTTAGWGETTLTWNNAPALGASLGALGPTTTGTWVERELGPGAINGDGAYSFGIKS